MANAAQTSKLQLGKLSPEDAERLASTFRPIWDLDDAPFAQGSALNAADIDALAGGAGVSPSIRGTQQQQEPKTDVTMPRASSSPGHVPAVGAPKVEIAVELDTEDLVSAAPAPVQPQVAQARPQAPSNGASAASATVRKPYTPPRAPPQAINMRDADASADLAPVKKSNMGIIIGLAAAVAIVGGIFVVRAMTGDKTQSGTNASPSQTNHEEGTHIPPPPEVAATQTTAAPTQTAAPVVTVKATNDSPIVKEFPGSTTTSAPPPPATTHATATAAIHQAPHSGGGATTHTGGSGKPPGKPAIVRDNPF